MTETHHMRAYEQLYTLSQTLRGHGAVADLRDTRVEVTWRPPDGEERLETITCTPRSDDGGKLWFWDSHHRPIGQADQVADTALLIAGALKATAPAGGE